MKKTLPSRKQVLHLIQHSLSTIEAALGHHRLSPAQRRSLRGQWSHHIPVLGARAVEALAALGPAFGDVPFTADDLDFALREADDAQIHLSLVEGTAVQARDALLVKRQRALRMTLAVVERTRNYLANPFLPERERRRACALAARLNAPLAQRAGAISKAMRALAAAAKKAATRRLSAAHKDLRQLP